MIKIITILTKFIVAAIVALSFASCRSNDSWGMGTKGNGEIKTETRTINEPFTGVKVSASIEVEIEQSDKQFVSVSTDENLLSVIDTKVENGILIIKSNANYSTSKGVKVIVKTPKINSLKASSSSSISTNGTITGSNMLIDASSSANLTADLQFDTIEVESSSSADIKLSGKALTVNCNASSSSSIFANTLFANDIVANANSSALIQCHPIVSLIANANSSADINYEGTPKSVEKKESSSGSVSGK